MDTKEKRIRNSVSMSQVTNNIDTNITSLMHSINIAWTKVRAWQEVSRQRKELRNLNNQQLKDMGISRADALNEADRHFWDIGPVRDSSLLKRRNSRLLQGCNEATKLCNT